VFAIKNSKSILPAVRRGVAGFLWRGGPDNRGAAGAENSKAEDTPRYPHKFSHRICINLRGPPDRPWGEVPTPGPPASYTPGSTYTVANSCLLHINLIRDLGVTVDSCLKFDKHVSLYTSLFTP
jgi:hypothetical protein